MFQSCCSLSQTFSINKLVILFSEQNSKLHNSWRGANKVKRDTYLETCCPQIDDQFWSGGRRKHRGANIIQTNLAGSQILFVEKSFEKRKRIWNSFLWNYERCRWRWHPFIWEKMHFGQVLSSLAWEVQLFSQNKFFSSIFIQIIWGNLWKEIVSTPATPEP